MPYRVSWIHQVGEYHVCARDRASVVDYRFPKKAVAERYRVAVRQDVIGYAVESVPPERPNVIADGVILRLSDLRRHVADIDDGRGRSLQRVGNPAHQDIRQDARVQAARPYDHQIGVFDGADGEGMRRRVFRLYHQPLHAAAALGDAGLPAHELPIAEPRRQLQVGGRGRRDDAAHR